MSLYFHTLEQAHLQSAPGVLKGPQKTRNIIISGIKEFRNIQFQIVPEHTLFIPTRSLQRGNERKAHFLQLEDRCIVLEMAHQPG